MALIAHALREGEAVVLQSSRNQGRRELAGMCVHN